MLRFLAIKNLAVIDHLEVEFEGGLTVVTGETGAGKSMLVEAVDLLVGGRASADLVRTGEESASIQAIFERADGREVIVCREVSATGRSRAFIDDTLATSAALRELGASLVGLHGQHEHQELLNEGEHLAVLDAFAEHDADVDAVARRFSDWQAARIALDRTRLSAQEKAARADLVSFQLGEIDRLAPVEGEDERLADERAMLANADRLGRLSSEAYAALYEGEHAAMTSLATVWRRVSELADIDGRLTPYIQQRDGVHASLEDLAYFLRSYSSSLDTSPDRLQQVEDRLAAIDRVRRKYGPTLTDVLSRQQSLRADLAALQASDEEAGLLESRAAAAAAAFVDLARPLSEARRKAATRLDRALESALAELAMPSSRVEMRVSSNETEPGRWTAAGIDEAALYLSPNPGEDLRPLARIASGGELSRIMLALKTIAATTGADRTLIFDEVDAGIGGEAADAVGARLQALGATAQVLCVTHLPQIAARGAAHFHISKDIRGGRTVVSLAKLDDGGRERELGRMIAGAEVSAPVLESARDLLRTRRAKHEQTPKGESETGLPAKAKGKRRGA